MLKPPPFIFGNHDVATLAQLAQVAQNAERVALMADGHVGYCMPIGGVAAYKNKVSPVGVGFDIACGNCAIRTDLDLFDLHKKDIGKLADEIQKTISFGIGRKNESDDAPTDHSLFEDPAWEAIPAYSNPHNLKGKARSQLGTVGSGNHYVDVFVDAIGRVWVGVHFGSRGFGHTIASGFLALSQNLMWGHHAPEREVLLDLETELGGAYWALMELAGRYAYVGREWVARKVVRILGGKEVDMVHNHHNFAWKEHHFDEQYVVVRKGATPAFPMQKGFVGGSMGDHAVIIQGADSMDDGYDMRRHALYSTVHGAGRVMSRTQAAGKWDRKRKVYKTQGLVSWDMVNAWLGPQGIVLRGGGLDEAPQAYRRLPDVLKAQGPTIKVLHQLQPIIVVMAGENEHDPYKD